MNNIQAVFYKSNYEIYGNYLNFMIDGYFLDKKLEQLFPENYYEGLVPTLNWWMEIPEESKIVWDRILPKIGERTICPILMCPDDADFSCTLIVVEILRLPYVVIWERMGLNKTISLNPEKVGQDVEWFKEIKPLSFEISLYKELLTTFKTRFEKDKKEWLEANPLNRW